MSSQSRGRPASALSTTRTSAEQVIKEQPGANANEVARPIIRPANGNPPSETSIGVPSDDRSSRMRFRSANAAASGTRDRYYRNNTVM